MQTVGSDHRIVTCFVKASYRVNRKAPSDPLKKVDWSSITNKSQLSFDYSVEVQNRYNALLQEKDTEEDYDLLIKSVTGTALEMLPKKKDRRRSNPYKDPDITHHRNILKEASMAHRSSPSFITKDSLEKAKKDLDCAYTSATERDVNQKTSQLESTNPEYRHGSSWHIIRGVTASNTVPFSKVPGETSEARLNTWYEHFKTLLGTEPPTPDLSSSFFNNRVSDTLPISCRPFNDAELHEVI